MLGVSKDVHPTTAARIVPPSASPFLNTLEILGLKELERICLSPIYVRVCDERTERVSTQRPFGQPQNSVYVALQTGR